MTGQLKTENSFNFNIPTKKSWYSTWWGVLLIIFLMIVGSFAVAIGFVIREKIATIKAEQSSPLYGLKQEQLSAPNFMTPAMGSSKPKFDLIFFADFGCEVSKNEATVVRDFVIRHSKDVKLSWRDYPVVTDNSTKLALAGRCAQEQNLFWPIHDYMYEHQGEEPGTMVMTGAKKIGMNLPIFIECVKNEKYMKQIRQDLAEAIALKLPGTPSMFINGYRLPAGEVPMQLLEAIIAELDKKSTK